MIPLYIVRCDISILEVTVLIEFFVTSSCPFLTHSFVFFTLPCYSPSSLPSTAIIVYFSFHILNRCRYCTEIFDYLSLSAIIDDKVFCVHGGLSPAINTLDQVRRTHEKILKLGPVLKDRSGYERRENVWLLGRGK